jgi:hypothetical protein
MIKGFALVLTFLFMQNVTFAQGYWSKYSELQKQFAYAETFDDVLTAYEALKQYRCMVDYYPSLAVTALQEDNRKQGLFFLNQALRAGYDLNEMQKSAPDAYNKISQLTIDSLYTAIRLSYSIDFDWRKRQELEAFFIDEQLNNAQQECDTNQRILAMPLRNLLNQYVRKNGLPNDCEVGYGMLSKSITLIFNKSYLLHNFEWDELDKALFEATKNYQISKELYVRLVDYYYYKKDKTTRFGSISYADNPAYFTYVEENRAAINRERNQLGLPDLPTK